MLGQVMEPKSKEVSSPSRTYVAMCNKANFNGYYFRKFTLPQFDPYSISPAMVDVEDDRGILENNCQVASWYFLNRLNFEACIEGVMPFENYQDISDQS